METRSHFDALSFDDQDRVREQLVKREPYHSTWAIRNDAETIYRMLRFAKEEERVAA